MMETIFNKMQHFRESGDRESLYSYTLYLRSTGLSLSQISEPLGVSRTTVHRWERAAVKRDLPPPRPLPEVPFRAPSQDLYEEIRETAEMASKRTRWSKPDSPAFQASEKLNKLIDTCIPPLSVKDFAYIAGVSRKIISNRRATNREASD